MTTSIAIPQDTAPTRRACRLTMESALSVAEQVHRLRNDGRSIVDLSIGEPAFPTPPHIIEEGILALRAGDTHYAPHAGLPELREAIAAALAKRGIATEPGGIVVTPGAKPALLYAVLALIQPGDEVLIPSPGFPIYRSLVRLAGGRPVGYFLRERDGFEPDPAELERRISARTRLLIINSPHNPTGGVIGTATLESIARLAVRHRLTVLSDEVYHDLRYDDGAASALSIAAFPGMNARAVVVDSFSKTWAMTGWRLGFIAAPPRLAPTIARFAVNGHTCVPPFVQRAGLAALRGPDEPIRQMLTEYRQRRDLLVAGLNRLGLPCRPPGGAFYAFPDISSLLDRCGGSDSALADRLLEEYGVATLPGSSFGTAGRGHLRLCFTAPTEQIQSALDRIETCVRSLLDTKGFAR